MQLRNIVAPLARLYRSMSSDRVQDGRFQQQFDVITGMTSHCSCNARVCLEGGQALASVMGNVDCNDSYAMQGSVTGDNELGCTLQTSGG